MNYHLDVLLIAPFYSYNTKGNIWKEVGAVLPPLGLASIAAFLRNHGFNIELVDCNIEANSLEDFESLIANYGLHKYSDIRYIGISSTTPTIYNAYKIGQICKKYYPRANVVFGGVHPSSLPEEVLDHDFADVVAIGEGELTFLDLVGGKSLKDIPGIMFKGNENGKKIFIKTKPRERILNINELPMPAYDLLSVHKYKPAKGSYKRLPAMSMMTSRGCPGKCTFCNNILGANLVFKSAEKIFHEAKYLIENYGIKHILFYDDTFMVYKKNVHALCDMIIDNNLDITWTCFARVDFTDLKVLKKMSKAGCTQILYGIESVNKSVLDNINKNINIKQIMQAVKWTKQAGIECRVSFMIGNPGDTKETIMNNIKFIKKLNPDLLVVNITTPYPGTQMYNLANSQGLIQSHNWENYDLSSPIMKIDHLSREEIKKLYRLMYRKFYFSPRFLFRHLFSIKSFEDFRNSIDSFKALVGFLK